MCIFEMNARDGKVEHGQIGAREWIKVCCTILRKLTI